ncbi:MAG: amidohydrolase family protein, partial [Acidobacteriota bacterium]
MNRRLRLTPLVVLSVTVLAGGAPVQESGDEDVLPQPYLALTHVNVVDVRSGDIARDVTVVLRDGKIASVGAGEGPADAEVIDLKGRYLLPGLMDAHTHLDDLSAARRALESGVTTVRSASVGSYRDVAIREMVKSGYLAGPDMLAAGVFVTPNLTEAILADPLLGKLVGGVNTADKLRHLVRVNLSHGVDVIKTRGTERAGLPNTDPRKQVYTESELRVVVEEAAGKGVPVLCHAHGDEGAMAAVRAGVRSIEHGTYLSDATLALMKEKGTYLVPTYTTMIDLLESGGDYDHPVVRIRGMHMLPHIQDTFRRARREGVKIVTGADTGYGPESITRIPMEIVNFVELGMSPVEAIQSATTLAAELFQIESKAGTIEVGLEADLVAIEGNPLENIRFIQDVLLVI